MCMLLFYLAGSQNDCMAQKDRCTKEAALQVQQKKKRIFVAICKGSVLVLGSPGTVVLHAPAAICELRQQKGHPCSSQGLGCGFTHCNKSISSISWHL